MAVNFNASITQKKLIDDTRKRVLIFTSNPLKEREYRDILEKTYGANLYFRPSTEELTEQVVRRILSEQDPSPHYIFREESSLINSRSSEVLDPIEIIEHPEKAPEFLYNASKVVVWIPSWNEDSTLAEIKTRIFEHKIPGYIDPSFKDLRNPLVFGWDHLFVHPETERTNLSNLTSPWGKISARQLAIDGFVNKYFLYEKSKTLKYNKGLEVLSGIDFSKEMSVENFLKNNIHLSNPHLNDWMLPDLMERILDEGVYFKASSSRPMSNYFSPPFGGIPLTPKKSEIEETVFMFHDLNHHNIPDLIFEGVISDEGRFIYAAWRLISEAMTLVLADMCYADTLVKTNPENERFVDQRIYPLFKAVDMEKLKKEGADTQEIMKKLLLANTLYAVLGDDSGWKKLLKEGEEAKLDAYKNHFGKFFIGDHVWSDSNLRNMVSIKESYQEWKQCVGSAQFKRSNLLLLDDIVEKIRRRGADLSSFQDVVLKVFDEVIETRIFPIKPLPQIRMNEEERLSRGFLRYMIGQMSFYSRYKDLSGIPERAKKLSLELSSYDYFDQPTKARIYQMYKNDVRHVWGMNCMMAATAENYMQLHPIFPPVYINYNKQECKTVAEVVAKLYGASS